MADEIVNEIPDGTLPPEVPPVENEGEPPKKKRGRPVGSGKKTPENIEAGATGPAAAKAPGKRTKVSYDKETIALMGKQLVGLHLLAAMGTGIHEMQISEPEGYALAQGIVNVCEQYNLSIDGKTGAALQLAMTAGMVYGPRLLAVRKRANDEAKARGLSTGPIDGNQNQSASAN